MKMDGDIRVKVSDRYGKLYGDLKNLVAGDSHELFFLCACLAHKRDKHKPLGKTGSEKFWSRTITPREWSCYYAMALADKQMDFTAVQDDEKVISHMEGYANAGMELLIDEFLHDFLLGKSQEPELDPTISKDLPNTFLYFFFDQVSDDTDGKQD